MLKRCQISRQVHNHETREHQKMHMPTHTYRLRAASLTIFTWSNTLVSNHTLTCLSLWRLHVQVVKHDTHVNTLRSAVSEKHLLVQAFRVFTDTVCTQLFWYSDTHTEKQTASLVLNPAHTNTLSLRPYCIIDEPPANQPYRSTPPSPPPPIPASPPSSGISPPPCHSRLVHSSPSCHNASLPSSSSTFLRPFL